MTTSACKVLALDIESYSSVDLVKSGVYRYAEAPDFQILLLAYAYDDGPVAVVDMVNEMIPAHVQLALTDPNVIKVAFNANFERVCLGKALGVTLPPEQWRCTMIHAATLGLPRSLGDVGRALGIPEDKQKMKEGKALITYFCKPCKPTKKNGSRIRNMPWHDLEKWRTFIEYNRRDVEVERDIRNILSTFPVPEKEWEAWWLDQHINDRGILADMDLVQAAIYISKEHSDDLTDEAGRLTQLENVRSVAQLKGWLGVEGSLDKKAVAALRSGELPDEVDRVLAIRQELGKSSVSKYAAIQRSVCKDGRVHGAFRFYGANRTGRWAGQIVQLQNLPQNHLPNLEAIRDIVKDLDRDGLQCLYGNVPAVLSELIRTAFVAPEGHTLVVADFNAIEARVIAWLADETWRQELFAKGGDIYCSSASQMFGVPVVKNGVNGHLRQKGKIAELACIAEDQLVLTEQGLVPIQNVTAAMRVWDGTEWVNHGGVVYRGEKEVITYEGLTATPDHIVWVEGQSQPVQLGIAAASGAHLLQTGDGRHPIRLGGGHQPRKTVEPELEPLLRSDKVRGVRRGAVAEPGQPANREIQGLPILRSTSPDLPEMAEKTIHGSKTALYEPEGQQLQELRSQGHRVPFPVGESRMPVHGGKSRAPEPRDGAGQNRCERPLRAGQPALGNASAELCKPAPLYQRMHVYDILNAGPRNRFTVSGVLVHNCGYGGGPGALRAMGALEMGIAEDELRPLVTAWREANPNIVDFWWLIDKAAKETIQLHLTDWRSDLPHGLSMRMSRKMLHIRLPSGRELRYWKPFLALDEDGRENICYGGMDAGRWSEVRTYGPKLVENIVQAISRDCLRDAMLSVSHLYPIIMHVHDEMVVEVPREQSHEALHNMLEIMKTPIPWAPGLRLAGDGYVCNFYQKG